MNRTPSGTDIVSKAPIKEWFNVSDLVKENWPEIPYWELSNTYNHAFRVLNRLAKWDECIKEKRGQRTYYCI